MIAINLCGEFSPSSRAQEPADFAPLEPLLALCSPAHVVLARSPFWLSSFSVIAKFSKGQSVFLAWACAKAI